MKKENQFQSELIKEIKEMFPGCIVIKNDSSHIQGIPDLSIFVNDKWAMLEVKRDEKAPKQPNQEYYVSKLSNMSFCEIIFPRNKEDVLNELQRALGS